MKIKARGLRHELRRLHSLRRRLDVDTKFKLRRMLDREGLDLRVLREKFLNLQRLVVDLLKSGKLGFIERGGPFDANCHDLDGVGAAYGQDARLVHDCNFFSSIDLGNCTILQAKYTDFTRFPRHISTSNLKLLEC